MARRASWALELIRDSLSVEEAAEVLDVAPHALVERVRDRALYGFDLGERLVLPRWQFSQGKPLPHLARVWLHCPPRRTR